MPTARRKQSAALHATESITASLGGPEVTRVFTSQLANPVLNRALPLYERYEERALLLARPHDVVCVTEPVDGDFLGFLRAMGMGLPPENIVVAPAHEGMVVGKTLAARLLHDPHAVKRIAGLIGERQKAVLNPFMALPDQFQLARAIGTAIGRNVEVLGGNPEIARRAYHKHLGKAKAMELGIPVAPGEVVELPVRDDGRPRAWSPLRAAVDRRIGATGKVIVRGSRGVSGSSTAIVKDSPGSFQEASEKLAQGEANSIYLVDVMFEALASPNVQTFIAPGGGAIPCVSVGDQLLNENLAHRGNVYPSRAKTLPEMTGFAAEMSRWLRDEGFTGLAGFDFVEYRHPRTGARECFLAELNARTNGVTYAKVLMERLDRRCRSRTGARVRAFLSRDAKTTARSFAELRDRYGRLFFDPDTGRGLFPYRTGCLERGEFSAAFLGGCRAEVETMYGEFEDLAARE